MHSEKPFGRVHLLWGVLVALLGVNEAHGAGKYTTPHNDVLMGDSIHMTKLFERQSDPWMKINFADPVQYRFVINRLLASGNTPDNSPYLFSRVERMRSKAVARQSGDVTVATNTKKCGHLLKPQKTNSGSNAVIQANPQVSCFSGADYVYADFYLYRSTEDGLNRTLLASNSGEEYGGGRNFEDVTVTASIPLDAGYKATYDSMVMAFDDAGEEFTSFNVQDTVIITTNFSYTITHPQERLIQPDATIRTCLERGAVTGNLDCDYASVVKNPTTGVIIPYGASGGQTPTGVAAVKLPVVNNTWQADPALYWTPTDVNGAAAAYDRSKLYLPLAGKIKATDPACVIKDFEQAKTMAVLIVKQAGGTCVKYNVNDEIEANNFRAALMSGLPASGLNEVAYSFLGDFGQDCLAYLTDQTGQYWQDLELAIQIRPSVQCGNASIKKPYAVTRTGLWLDFRNSCIAEGTSVLKADGTEAPIEDIKVGDKIMANASGLALTVNTVSRGRESKEMVRLSDEKGRQVLLTRKHPLVTAQGVVLAAEQVKAGEQMMTRDGKTTITAVDHVAYKGQVYNLALGTSEELAKVGEKDRTLLANGFVVGDSQMQTELEMRLSAKPATGDVLARLPKALHRDYKNDQARKAALKQ